MTESQLRQKVLDWAMYYYNYAEDNLTGAHHQIVDNFNRYAGTSFTYTDFWCSMTATVIGVEAGIGSIIPITAACTTAANWFKARNKFKDYYFSSSGYIPKPGDYVYYCRLDPYPDDADHVGIVYSVNGTSFKSIDGNWSDGINYHDSYIGDSELFGFGVPDYASLSDTVGPDPIEPDNPPSGTKYTVQAGDTLNSIAAKFNTTAEAIAEHNHLSNPNLIYVGQTLYILASTAPAYTEYTVKSGDSLGRIAVAHGLIVAVVASYNGISSPYTIYVGKKLHIPTAGRKNWVKEFQLAIIASGISSLPRGGADGEWGSETEAAAAQATVKSGVENPMAKFAQQMLIAYGYSLPQFGADGEFWGESVNAAIRYQEDHGLVADGVIGLVTWKDMLQVS